jgi:hypothetical protein
MDNLSMRPNYCRMRGTAAHGIQVWSQEPDPTWYFERDGQVVATASITTTQERVTDWSGRRAYRVRKDHLIELSVRTGYRLPPIMVRWDRCGNLREALEDICKAISIGVVWIHAEMAASALLAEAGASDAEISNLRWSTADTAAVVVKMARRLVELKLVIN